MDKILIRDLAVTTIVGTLEKERVTPRTVLFNLELALDLAPAGRSDDLCCSVNYQQVAKRLTELGRESKFFLIEALAERACALILEEFPAVETVKLTLDKPGALSEAASVAVSIERRRVPVFAAKRGQS